MTEPSTSRRGRVAAWLIVLVDEAGHRWLHPELHDALLGRVCDRREADLGGPVPDEPHDRLRDVARRRWRYWRRAR